MEKIFSMIFIKSIVHRVQSRRKNIKNSLYKGFLTQNKPSEIRTGCHKIMLSTSIEIEAEKSPICVKNHNKSLSHCYYRRLPKDLIKNRCPKIPPKHRWYISNQTRIDRPPSDRDWVRYPPSDRATPSCTAAYTAIPSLGPARIVTGGRN